MDGAQRNSMSVWAILGCGYVGKGLASRLLMAGHEAVVTSRSSEGQATLAKALPQATALQYNLGETLAKCSHYDVVVLSVPPGEKAPQQEHALARQLGPTQRLIYLSTTGVYAPAGGGKVQDDSALGPTSERSQRRLAVEEALCQAHDDTVSLRIASIYGPGRGVHERMRRGNYRLVGAANTLVSRIFVDDLVSAIEILGHADRLDHQTYVVADECPTSATEHARGISERLGISMPTTVSAGEVSSSLLAMMTADRAIVPARLHALGWRAQFPTWKEGLERALSSEAGTAKEEALRKKTTPLA